MKKWDANHPEKVRESKSRWARNHPQNGRDKFARHYKKHRPEILERSRKWREDNPEKEREKKRRYRLRHPDKVKAEKRAYYLRHRDEIKAKARDDYRRRRGTLALKVRRSRYRKTEAHKRVQRHYQARKRGAKGQHTAAQWSARIQFYGWRCVYCSVKLTPSTVTQDHRIPLAKGGTQFAANLVPACNLCNATKGARRWKLPRAPDRLRAAC